MNKVAKDYVYTEPTADYNLLGSLNEKDEAEAMKVTEAQNVALEKFKGKRNVTQEEIEKFLPKIDYYEASSPEEITAAAIKVMDKLKIINSENFKWFELLIAFLFGYLGYCNIKQS